MECPKIERREEHTARESLYRACLRLVFLRPHAIFRGKGNIMSEQNRTTMDIGHPEIYPSIIREALSAVRGEGCAGFEDAKGIHPPRRGNPNGRQASCTSSRRKPQACVCRTVTVSPRLGLGVSRSLGSDSSFNWEDTATLCHFRLELAILWYKRQS